jgi:biotin operon repressor
LKFVDIGALGRNCRYSDARIYYLLYHLDKHGVTSREDLANELDVSEGTVRKMLTILKKWGVISISYAGVDVTPHGRTILDAIPINIFAPPISNYVIGRYQSAVVVKGVSDKVTDGIQQRNNAIIAGARGASVFKMEGGMLIMPPKWNMDDKDPVFAGSIRSAGVRDGDVVIITGARDDVTALMTSITAALDMF